MIRSAFFEITRIASILFVGSALMTACTDVVQPPANPVPWDTAFSISGIEFPNDSIYSRSVSIPPSNWRIKRFIKKCQSQKSIKIGFIGGSITWGAWSSSSATKYSSLFCSSLKRCFPNLEQVSEINAGISATPSRFGCSRLKSDLLSSSPDLVVIEFAVNDFGQGDDMFLRSTIEGLIRQCLASQNEVPVVLLFTSKGDGTNVQALQSEVGSYYSLPLISYRDAIWPLIESGQVPFNTFFHDDPHPNDNGHRVCAYLLYSYVKNEIAQPEGPVISFPSFQNTDVYEFAGSLSTGDSAIEVTNAGWKTIVGDKARLGFLSEGPDTSTLQLKSQRREMTLGVHMQPGDTSSIRIIVDDGKMDTTLSNNYVFEYTNFFRLYLSDTNVDHNIRIKKQGKSSFKIDCVLYAGNPSLP